MRHLGMVCAMLLSTGAMQAIGTETSPCASAPSHFDYLVLASMADASQPIAIALYRSENQK